MWIFRWYIIKEHIAPFLFAFAVIMFVLILKLMLTLIDLLMSRSVGPLVILKLFIYNLAWMVALVVPMSVLVSTVMAFGRMGAAGEIVAMKAAGISMYRLVLPVLLISILLTVGMIWFNNVILPEANFRASSLRQAVVFMKPMVTLQNREGQFVTADDIPFTIRVTRIDYDTDELIGVNLFTKAEQDDARTMIVAERGRFIAGKDRLELILHNGEVHRRDPVQPAQYVRSSFDTFSYIVRGLNFGLDTSITARHSDRTMTSAMMRDHIKDIRNNIVSWNRRIDELSAEDAAQPEQIAALRDQVQSWRDDISRYLVEIHKKNSIPFAAIIFVLIGSSLGILIRRSGASIGIGLSIGFFMLYYMFLIAGENLADRMLVLPWISMWAPNIVLGIVGIAMFRHAVRR